LSYVLTRDFDEFAGVREDLLLRIMSFVEDSGTRLASPSQTLYLSQDSGLEKNKIKTPLKNAPSESVSDHPQSESGTRRQKTDDA